MERIIETADYGPCGGCGTEGLAASVREPEGFAGPFDLLCKACGWTLYVPAETTARTRIAAIREIVEQHSAKRIDGFLVDATTANALLAIYNALSPQAREKFGKPSLPRLVDLAWKHVRLG